MGMDCVTKTPVDWRPQWSWLVFLVCLGASATTHAQIDPEKRRLFQLGYNQPLQGRGPLSGYAFYYFNEPGFLQTNLTLRLAIAPVYVDSELGIRHALGPNTDLAVGLAGGGFADSYSEIRLGKLLRDESFTGDGGDAGVSIYHRFNPDHKIPLTAILRGSVHYTAYQRDDDTAPAFTPPSDHATLHLRTGLRWGGREPLMLPSLAMELSAWYEGHLRGVSESYGFNGDRELKDHSHLFWGRALLTYTLPELKHNFSVSLTAGTSLNADRFSAYRLGGALPLVSEFPLTLPGYYFQELSADRFVLVSGQYSLPLDRSKQWGLMISAATAAVDYLPALEQPGRWNSGVGAGVVFRSKSEAWHLVVGYAYGIDAIRDGDRGAHSVGILIQYDLEADRRGKKPFWDPWLNPNKWRGFDRLFGR
ncbi:MAG: hypothetical protein DME18_00055 [Verrucomicrobia bacterium]|nr:MAG: hypothetical protein DME18_00055 [Verrucomicrobiota bacterium]